MTSKLRAAADTARVHLSKLHPDYRALDSFQAPAGVTPAEHLQIAMEWICRAQDATPDDGVARGYGLLFKPYFGGRGWQPSYPETTGYIIPTFFDYAAHSGKREYAARAVRMAVWESEVQLDTGAVQGGVIGQRPSPAVFNTGQVIFGWLRAHAETGDRRFLDSATRAGRWLVDQLSEDGGWYKGLSEYAGDGKMNYSTYNVRCAWALVELGDATGDRHFHDAARRAAQFALDRQQENGWYPSNCLFNPKIPYLHTVAYATRGLIETGLGLGEQRFVDAGRKAADAILATQWQDGGLSGRFDADWKPIDDWCCLTGLAQIALAWGRLYETAGNDTYLAGLRRAASYLRAHQLYMPNRPNLHGAIAGAFPFSGRYGAYELLNWAAKFFADLQMMEMRLAGASARATAGRAGV